MKSKGLIFGHNSCGGGERALDNPDVALRVQNTLSGSSQGWQLLIALLRETQHFIVPQSCAFPNTEPRAAIMIRLVIEISNSLLLL